MIHRLAAVAGSAVLLAAAGCTTAAPPPLQWRRVSTSDAVLSVDLPDGWGTTYAFTEPAPARTGLLIRDGRTLRVSVSASRTAMRDTLGAVFDRPSVTPFRDLVTALDQVIKAPGTIDECVFVTRRPVSAGRFYGVRVHWDGCTAGGAERTYAAAVSADRTVVVLVSVAADEALAERVLTRVLEGVEVKLGALPLRVERPVVTAVR